MTSSGGDGEAIDELRALLEMSVHGLEPDMSRILALAARSDLARSYAGAVHALLDYRNDEDLRKQDPEYAALLRDRLQRILTSLP